jgi:hypothetical protein
MVHGFIDKIMITEIDYLKAKKVVADYELSNGIKPVVSDRCFSKFDMQGAFEAGEELKEHEWHMTEFHGFSCKCTPLDYVDFKTWFEKHCH